MTAHKENCRILYTNITALSSSFRAGGRTASHATVVLATGFALTKTLLKCCIDMSQNFAHKEQYKSS